MSGVAPDSFSLFEACLFTSSLYRKVSALTSCTPKDKRAAKGTEVKSFSAGISSTAILTICVCSSVSDGILISGKPGTRRTLGITFSLGSTGTVSVFSFDGVSCSVFFPWFCGLSSIVNEYSD